MSALTINQIDELFGNIAKAHEQISDYFFTVDISQIEAWMNTEVEYPALVVILMDGTTQEQVKLRNFQVMVMDVPKKDKSNLVEVLSDTEQILDDVIEILKKNSFNYDVIGDPQTFPYDEKHTDWVSGYRAEVLLQTEKKVTLCNIPAGDIIDPPVLNYNTVEIVDQDGNVLQVIQAKPGAKYVVTVLTGIDDTLTANVTTIADNIL